MSNTVVVPLALIEQRSEKVTESGCWIWIGATFRGGYGQLTYRGQHFAAHRCALSASGVEVPDGAFVCHRCDVRECCNPSHLYVGDATTNRQDALHRERWAHPWRQRDSCSHGHVYEEVGFRIAKDGARVCRECMRLAQRKFRRNRA